MARFVRCDNAGENLALQTLCEQEGLQVKFEFTEPGTPQQNVCVERLFATFFGRIRAMLNNTS